MCVPYYGSGIGEYVIGLLILIYMLKSSNPYRNNSIQFSSIQLGFIRAHSEQAVIAHACHGHTPTVINWAVCLGQKVSN